MDKHSLPLEFEMDGLFYKGWATPSEIKYDDGSPRSYKVVLNRTTYGNFFRNRGKWFTDEQLSHGLVVAVGDCLDRQTDKRSKIVATYAA